MVRRFTLAGLLLWVALVALVLAIVVPIYRWRNRSPLSGTVVSVAASADGSTLAALLGDGSIFVWDEAGRRKAIVQSAMYAKYFYFDDTIAWIGLSPDGKLAATSGARWHGGDILGIDVWDVETGKLIKTVPDRLALDTRFACAGAFTGANDRLIVQSKHVPTFDDHGFRFNRGGEPIVPTITIDVCPLDEDAPPQTIPTPFYFGRFALNGKLFAGVTKGNELWIYDMITSKMAPTFAVRERSGVIDLAWSTRRRQTSGRRSPDLQFG